MVSLSILQIIFLCVVHRHFFKFLLQFELKMLHFFRKLIFLVTAVENYLHTLHFILLFKNKNLLYFFLCIYLLCVQLISPLFLELHSFFLSMLPCLSVHAHINLFTFLSRLPQSKCRFYLCELRSFINLELFTHYSIHSLYLVS